MLHAAKIRVCTVVDISVTDCLFEGRQLDGSGLTVEISPLSFPNRSVILRGVHAAVEMPDRAPGIPHPVF